MLLNSFSFLGFFALVAVLYFIVPHRWRWVLLLIASYYFYSTYKVGYLFLLAFSTLVAYLAAVGVRGRQQTGAGRTILTVAVVVEVLLLVVFKYFDFFSQSIEQGLGLAAGTLPRLNDVALPVLEPISNALGLGAPGDIVLPAGLSFYVFSSISYIVDVYRKKIEPEYHLGKLALYVSFFPKLLAGPIERAGPFLEQLKSPTTLDAVRIAAGLQLVLWGLFKKVVIADRLAAYVNDSFRTAAFEAPVKLVIAIYFYAFQIYCDFSGYSDIAIGLALILGFRLIENFRRPYFAKNISEFWSGRWHISLMMWFRDYLYIPLGGNRVSRVRWYLNQIIVFVTSGLWHGSNWTFVIWGGLNGFYQVVYFMIVGDRKSDPVALRRNVLATGGLLAVAAAVLAVVAATVGTFPGLVGESLIGGIVATIFLFAGVLFFAEGRTVAIASLIVAVVLAALFGYTLALPIAIALAGFAAIFLLAPLKPSRIFPRWLWSLLSSLVVFHVVLLSWVFFRAESVGKAWTVITRIWNGIPMLPQQFAAYDYNSHFLISVGLIVVLLLIEALDEFRGMWAWINQRSVVVRWGFYYLLLAALVLIGQWGVSEFVYMQF